MPLPEPRSAFHQRLEKIADNIARLGNPNGEVIAFFMCTFNRNGVANAPTNNLEAAWLRAALSSATPNTNSATTAFNLVNIVNLSPEAFRLAMRTVQNTSPSALMKRIDNDDLLEIHAVASAVWAAIQV
jgi:hypothetical protein